MVDYVFSQDYITQKGSHGKYPVKTCYENDDLSGDMLAPSWPNLVCVPDDSYPVINIPLFTESAVIFGLTKS